MKSYIFMTLEFINPDRNVCFAFNDSSSLKVHVKQLYLRDSERGVSVPSPRSTTLKKFNWSPSLNTSKVTCLLPPNSSLLASTYSAISLKDGSSIGTEDQKHVNQTFSKTENKRIKCDGHTVLWLSSV